MKIYYYSLYTKMVMAVVQAMSFLKMLNSKLLLLSVLTLCFHITSFDIKKI